MKYQVARVDWALKNELGIPGGLADENVLVLDPCCGTGAYLVEVLRHIHAAQATRDDDALAGGDLKAAALTRIFGFEILPAPFVVSHLQLGLLLQQLGAPLASDRNERIPVFLTNALTGWEPPAAERSPLLFPALEHERELAEQVKRERRILVILGNPPYDSFTEVAKIEEERSLTTAYRQSHGTRQPEGQGLNDLYVRFFRMAERRIVEMTGEGVVCYISNYSWLDGLSHPAMREKYLEEFDSIRIDSLNGDRNRTGKVAPDGSADPSVFSTSHNPQGIKVGTAIALLVRKGVHHPAAEVLYRDFWGRSKREELLAASQGTSDRDYQHHLIPRAELGYPFLPVVMDEAYLSWPLLPALLPTSFAGVKTSRDDVLVEIDRDRLAQRMSAYFDTSISHDEMAAIAPGIMASTARFRATQVRELLQRRGMRGDQMVRYLYRPFDSRWLFWESETKLLDEKRSEYVPHVRPGNLWIEARQKQTMDDFDRGMVVTELADNLGNGLSNYYPLYLSTARTVFAGEEGGTAKTPNLSAAATTYLNTLGVEPRVLFLHIAAILNTPKYRAENAGALRLDWPRVPLPTTAAGLNCSAELGSTVATLFDTSAPVAGVTGGTVTPDFRVLGPVSRAGGGRLDPSSDLSVEKRWGYIQSGVVFPGPDSAVQRERTPEEMAALAVGAQRLGLSPEKVVELLGTTTFDIPLNDVALWANVPERVWRFNVSGYNVLKKWLSYRELTVLGRPLRVDEAREFTAIVQRIAALLLLGPALDASYRVVAGEAARWNDIVE